MDGYPLIVSPGVPMGLLGALVAQYAGTTMRVCTGVSGGMRLSLGGFGALCFACWRGGPLLTVVSGGQGAMLIGSQGIVTWAVLALVCLPLGTLQMLGAEVRTLYVKLWASFLGEGWAYVACALPRCTPRSPPAYSSSVLPSCTPAFLLHAKHGTTVPQERPVKTHGAVGGMSMPGTSRRQSRVGDGRGIRHWQSHGADLG
jgi:hypothetical protein